MVSRLTQAEKHELKEYLEFHEQSQGQSPQESVPCAIVQTFPGIQSYMPVQILGPSIMEKGSMRMPFSDPDSKLCDDTLLVVSQHSHPSKYKRPKIGA